MFYNTIFNVISDIMVLINFYIFSLKFRVIFNMTVGIW